MAAPPASAVTEPRLWLTIGDAYWAAIAGLDRVGAHLTSARHRPALTGRSSIHWPREASGWTPEMTRGEYWIAGSGIPSRERDGDPARRAMTSHALGQRRMRSAGDGWAMLAGMRRADIGCRLGIERLTPAVLGLPASHPEDPVPVRGQLAHQPVRLDRVAKPRLGPAVGNAGLDSLARYLPPLAIEQRQLAARLAQAAFEVAPLGLARARGLAPVGRAIEAR